MDGIAVMQPQPHVDWIARSLLMLNRYLLRQLPPQYQVEVDADKFLQSLSFLDGDVRRAAGSWDMAPEAPVHEEPQSEHDGA